MKLSNIEKQKLREVREELEEALEYGEIGKETYIKFLSREIKMKFSESEEQQFKDGKEYLDDLSKSGEIDEETYLLVLDNLKKYPRIFIQRNFSEKHDELLLFGKSFKEVFENSDKKECHQILSNISAIIMYKEQEHGIDSLTPKERYIYAIDGMLTEVNNGGFNQFFFNSTGELTYDLVPALEEIGSKKFKSIVSKAVDIFGDIPSLDEDSRYSHLEKITKDDELQLWDECDDEFYNCDEDIESMTVAYAKANLI